MFPLPTDVQACLETLRHAGFEAYPVGGCVRDLLLGRTPGDWDVTTSAPPETVTALFEKTIPTGLKHGTVTVLLGSQHLEVTTFRADLGYSDGRHPDAVAFGQSLAEDLARRDFTINAMALGEDAAVIDPFGGQADLAEKRVRAVGDPRVRFREDALRMFRAIRFAAQLGFSIDVGTWEAILELAGNSKYVSGERIKVEVEKTLISERPEGAFLFLSAGLLPGASTVSDISSKALPPYLPNASFLLQNAPNFSQVFTNTPPDPGSRWRAFCRATGFDITSLPTERRLRAAVLHPEREGVKALALKASDLMALGYEGRALGVLQLHLARHILAHPEDNTPEVLTSLVKALSPPS